MHHSQGYGYPTFLIQAPLAFYVAEFFVLLGIGVTNGVKAAWAVAFLGSAWGMYALVRRWVLTWPWQHTLPETTRQAQTQAAQAGFIAGLLYVYAPYHLLDIYVRAALAETMLMAWLPWTFWAFDRLIADAYRPGWEGRLAVAALCYAALMLSHAFALMAVTPVLVAFVLFRLWVQWRHASLACRTNRRPWRLFVPPVAMAMAAGVAALLLVAIFVLPLLSEGPLLVQEDWVRDTYNYSRHWVHWGQFLSPFWGYGYSDDPTGANDGMGFQIGALLVVLALTASYLLLAGRWRTRSLPLFLLFSTATLLYLMTPAADWLWRSIPLLAVLQFPWRLLTLVTMLLSALGGLTVCQFSQIAQPAARPLQEDAGILVIGILIIFASAEYIRPPSLEPIEAWREDGRAVFEFERAHPDMLGYTTLVEERFAETPLTPQYAAGEFGNDKLERLGVTEGTGVVTSHYSRGHHFGGEVVTETPAVVQIRLYAFPGWEVRLNGVPVEYRVARPHALMEIDVPAGSHKIDVRMGTTPVRILGLVVSGLTLVVLAGLWARGKQSHRNSRLRHSV
jgi:hypothetical protein